MAGPRSRVGPRSTVPFAGAVTLPDDTTYQGQQEADADAMLAGRRTTAEIGLPDQLGTTG